MSEEQTFEQMLEETFKQIHNGEVLDGEVIEVRPDEAILNIGYKYDGVLTKREYSNDSDVELSTLRYLAENHEPKAVVTVIETKGSTPRGTGAKMAVSPLGKVTGSIGGGCSEAAVIQDAVRIIGTGRYKLVDIDLTGEVAESDGMVCGGTMKVLVEDGSES